MRSATLFSLTVYVLKNRHLITGNQTQVQLSFLQCLHCCATLIANTSHKNDNMTIDVKKAIIGPWV